MVWVSVSNTDRIMGNSERKDISVNIDDSEYRMKFIIFNGEVIQVFKSSKDRWYDTKGTEYAYSDSKNSIDSKNRCGVGWFSLAEDDSRNDACAPHDFAYSSPAYQAFHTRAEADYMLKELLEKIPEAKGTMTPEIFYGISRELGFHFWENPETNN